VDWRTFTLARPQQTVHPGTSGSPQLAPMTDLLSGKQDIQQVSLGPLDVAVLALPG
jgi:hypothetical protein